MYDVLEMIEGFENCPKTTSPYEPSYKTTAYPMTEENYWMVLKLRMECMDVLEMNSQTSKYIFVVN